MSGIFDFSGMKTNKGEKLLDIEKYLNLTIKDIVIHSIPLKDNVIFSTLRLIGKRFQNLFHPKLTLTFSHIAIQLNLENDDIFIIEYGQYLTEDSQIDRCRETDNDNEYYYINKDGARLTKVNKEKYLNDENSRKYPLETILKIIASQNYHIPFEDFKFSMKEMGLFNGYHSIECNIKKRIQLKQLIEKFQDEDWEAKKYNVLFHNCQDFGAEIIKILKAIRKYDKDKIRTNEKMILPNCIISALWDNEDLSFINTMGRIPIIGMGFDIFADILA